MIIEYIIWKKLKMTRKLMLPYPPIYLLLNLGRQSFLNIDECLKRLNPNLFFNNLIFQIID
jgi:hypothetical protein